MQRKLSTRATFHYLEDRTEYKTTKPYHINLPERALPPGLQSNEVSIPYHGISVADIRDRQHNFKLDIHGFEVVVEDANDPSSLVNCIGYEDYADEALVRSKVREGVEAFLKRHISGCEDVVAFSHQVCGPFSSFSLVCEALGLRCIAYRRGRSAGAINSSPHYREARMAVYRSPFRVFTLVERGAHPEYMRGNIDEGQT